MPPLALAQLLHRAVPWLSPQGRAVINSLVCDNGRVGSAETLARRVGLRSRFQLNRLLHHEGLPPYEELTGWVCVFYWLLRADAAGDALRSLATASRMDTASCYRLVRRVTGRRWRELRQVGMDAALRGFLARCRSSATRLPPKSRLSGPSSEDRRDAPQPARPPLRLPLPGAPFSVALHGSGWAYVTLAHAAAVGRVDLAAGRVTTTFPVGCVPSGIAFDPSGPRAYVCVQYCDEIAVIDTVRHACVGSVPLPGDPFPLLLSRDGTRVYVTTNEDRLYCLNRKDGRVLAALSLPATSHHLALHPTGKRLYVATRTGGSVLEVDTARHEVLRTFRLGGWPQGLTLSEDGSTLYVANEQHGLDIVRLSTGSRVATLELDGACELALSSDHRVLYLGLVHAGQVKAIDCFNRRVLGTVASGGRPRGIACDRHSGVVVIANEAGWVDLLPLATAGDVRNEARAERQRLAFDVATAR